ncbi:MAG: hypothetical protein ACE5RT_07205 [Nitrosopumilaceae archaeon]
MNTRAILGVTLAAVFAFAMMTNPVFAISPSLLIAFVGTTTAPDTCFITAGGTPGTATNGHDVLVYVCATAPLGTAGNKVFLGAIHPSFNDDPEQAKGNKVIHTHEGELFADNCVDTSKLVDNPNGVASVSGNTITIPTDGSAIAVHGIVGYDFGPGGLCPTAVYAAV